MNYWKNPSIFLFISLLIFFLIIFIFHSIEPRSVALLAIFTIIIIAYIIAYNIGLVKMIREFLNKRK